MKTSRIIKAAPAIAMFLLIAGLPYVQAAPNSGQLNLQISGAIVNSGNQVYTQSGGQALSAFIFGQPVSPSSWSETVVATVSGLTVNGVATFAFTGIMANGSSVSLRGIIDISQQIPGESFPIGCTTSCTSAVPAFYEGSSVISVTVTSSSVVSPAMVLESAFLNPFGGAIVFASADGSIVIVATYTHAVINWSKVQVGGALSGTYGTKPVSGTFNEVTTAREDLFAGTETELGTMTFTNMTPSSLDASGIYSGHSTIPPINVSNDCSPYTTGIEGTCYLTGFSSAGQFTLSASPGIISGSYSLAWAIPALSATGTATATVIP